MLARLPLSESIYVILLYLVERDTYYPLYNMFTPKQNGTGPHRRISTVNH